MVGEFGVTPSEYWRMTPNEIALIIEAKRPKTVGGIPEDDFADMLNRRQELIEQGLDVL